MRMEIHLTKTPKTSLKSQKSRLTLLNKELTFLTLHKITLWHFLYTFFIYTLEVQTRLKKLRIKTRFLKGFLYVWFSLIGYFGFERKKKITLKLCNYLSPYIPILSEVKKINFQTFYSQTSSHKIPCQKELIELFFKIARTFESNKRPFKKIIIGTVKKPAPQKLFTIRDGLLVSLKPRPKIHRGMRMTPLTDDFPVVLGNQKFKIEDFIEETPKNSNANAPNF